MLINFYADVKKQKKASTWILHFINEEMDPLKAPVINIYQIDNTCVDGFIQMVKFQLKCIGHSKVIYEILDS